MPQRISRANGLLEPALDRWPARHVIGGATLALDRMSRLSALTALLLLAFGACAKPDPPHVPAAAPPPAAPPPLPSWCASVHAALGQAADTASFECLSLPNFLVTGFYGTDKNPERSDFINGCFAGDAQRASRVRMSVRPVGDLAFSYRAVRKLDERGHLDLGFLGPWAPRLSAAGASGKHVQIKVTLGHAEIRVLSSVAEILAQQYETAPGKPAARDALEACITSLCQAAPAGDGLVYTAKVLAAVPVISVRFDSTQAAAGGVTLLKGVAGFDVKRSAGDSTRFEIRAKQKLNVAALLEQARPAFERAGTCRKVQAARTRRSTIAGLRELGLQTAAGRELAKVPADAQKLRNTVAHSDGAFSSSEQSALLAVLEALDGASGELVADKPGKEVCETRQLLEGLLSDAKQDNRLHSVLADVAEPLERRLTDLANDRSLPCAEPAWFIDRDHDGYGDPRVMKRSSHQPPGYVANSLDCYDSNPDAHPGQTHYFLQQRGDGSFDYDCDGKQMRKDEVVSEGCKELTTLGYPTHCWADEGWQTSAPACGHQGRWVASCTVSGFSCSLAKEEHRQQRCR